MNVAGIGTGFIRIARNLLGTPDPGVGITCYPLWGNNEQNVRTHSALVNSVWESPSTDICLPMALAQTPPFKTPAILNSAVVGASLLPLVDDAFRSNDPQLIASATQQYGAEHVSADAFWQKLECSVSSWMSPRPR